MMTTRYYHGNSMAYMLDSIQDVLATFPPDTTLEITVTDGTKDTNDYLIELAMILLTAGTGDNRGHMHGAIDQHSRATLENLVARLETEAQLKKLGY